LPKRFRAAPAAAGPSYIDALRRSGIRIGSGCNIYGTNFDKNVPHLIEIGNDCTIAGEVTILAHDVSPSIWLGKTKLAPTRILDRCFIGQRALILAGVTIGPDAVVGAGAVVSKDVPARSVAAGNPARVICTLDEFLERQRADTRSTWVEQTMPGMDNPDWFAARQAARDWTEAQRRDPPRRT
jgi:acetyltransferase-like isoleucine patch superfamily enzyme